MAPAGDVLLTVVVPALGALVSLLMYASPVQAILNASKNRTLGDLNPVPFSITVANTIAWCLYGLIKQDPFVTAPNALGIVVALFCATTSLGLADDKGKSQIRTLLCVEGALLSLLGVLTSFAAPTLKEKLAIWGLAGNAMAMVYYASPLTTMAEVIRTRNSASILLPMTIMNTANAGLWTTYGIAMNDVYIYLPNGIGLVLSVAQLALAFLFPRRPKTAAAGGTGTGLHEAPYSRLGHADEEGVRLPTSVKV